MDLMVVKVKRHPEAVSRPADELICYSNRANVAELTCQQVQTLKWK